MCSVVFFGKPSFVRRGTPVVMACFKSAVAQWQIDPKSAEWSFAWKRFTPRKDGSLQCVPLVNVDRVTVCGEPAVTFPVLAALTDRNVPCSFMTAGGRWRGLMNTACILPRRVMLHLIAYDIVIV